jgi:hypothetical protein
MGVGLPGFWPNIELFLDHWAIGRCQTNQLCYLLYHYFYSWRHFELRGILYKKNG